MTRFNSLHTIFTVIFVTLFTCVMMQSMDLKTASSNPVDGLYYFKNPDNSYCLTTLLDQAVRHNRVNAVRHLLNRKANPNLINPVTGLPPLTTAILRGSWQTASLLIQAGALIKSADAHGGSPLLAAAEMGHVSMVTRLLPLYAHVDKRADAHHNGVTALMQAAQNGHNSVIIALVAAKASLDKASSDGLTALHKAVLNNHPLVVESLIKAGANRTVRDAYDKCPIDYATNDDMRKLLLNTKQPVKTAAHDIRPANDAITQSMRKVLQNTSFSEPKNIEQLNKNLIRAAQDGNPGELDSFLSQGADANGIFTQQVGTHIEQTTALCQAVQYNQLKGLNFLLKNGAKPNLAKPISGITPLFVAAFDGNTQAAVSLLDAKGDPNTPNVDGVTPLIVGSARGHKNLVKKLLYAQARVNDLAKNAFGITAVGQAAQQGFNQILATLIKAKGDVNQARTDGTTPLHNAVRNGHEKTTYLLLCADAQKDALDDEGKRPADYAKTDEIKALLMCDTTLGKKPAYKKAMKSKRKRHKRSSSGHE